MSLTIFRDGCPVILIDKHIGDDPVYGPGIIGSDFVRELNMLENSNYTTCEVWINSVGGSVMDGMDIYNAIRASRLEITTRNVGIAASISGIIFQAGDKRVMNDYALLMMHNPSGGDDAGLNAIKASLVTMLSNRCSKSEKQISNLMDKETWMDSSECMDYGFCDSIEVSIEVTEDYKNMSSFAAYNKLRLVVNKLVENKKDKKMLKVTNALNLSEDASEDSVLKEIYALKEQIASLTDSLKEKEDLIAKELKEKEDKEKELKAIELVENAINAKKIEATAKDSFVNLAKVDFEGTKKALDALEVVVVSNKLPLKTVEGESRNGWTYSDWEKKDPNGLANMYKNFKDEYDLLLSKHLKK